MTLKRILKRKSMIKMGTTG